MLRIVCIKRVEGVVRETSQYIPCLHCEHVSIAYLT